MRSTSLASGDNSPLLVDSKGSTFSSSHEFRDFIPSPEVASQNKPVVATVAPLQTANGMPFQTESLPLSRSSSPVIKNETFLSSDHADELDAYAQYVSDDLAHFDMRTPKLEMDEPFFESGSSEFIKEAISERLKTADASLSNVFEKIAKELNAEYGFHITEEDVSLQLNEDRKAVALLLKQEAPDDAMQGIEKTLVFNTEKEPLSETALAIKQLRSAHRKIEEPESKGKAITKGALLKRKLVDDPENPGQKITYAQRKGRKKVDDPQNPDKQITYSALKNRGRTLPRVVDPRNPEKILTLKALKQRERNAERVPDPKKPHRTISLSGLISREKRERQNLLLKTDADKANTHLYERKVIEDPEKPGVFIQVRSLQQRIKRHQSKVQ